MTLSLLYCPFNLCLARTVANNLLQQRQQFFGLPTAEEEKFCLLFAAQGDDSSSYLVGDRIAGRAFAYGFYHRAGHQPQINSLLLSGPSDSNDFTMRTGPAKAGKSCCFSCMLNSSSHNHLKSHLSNNRLCLKEIAGANS